MAFITLIACNGTSTGNPADGSEPDTGTNVPGGGSGNLGGEGGFCPAEPRVLDSLDAETGLSFTAADVLEFAGGTHEETLRWNEQEGVVYGPEHGEHALTITVTHEDGEIRLMEPDEDGSGSGQEPATDIGTLFPTGGCVPWIEIDVQVTMRTDGGALDETWDATLVARNPLLATLYVVTKPAELQGDFEVTEVALEGFTLAQLDVSMSFSPFGNSGTLSGTLEMRSEDAVSAAAGRGGPFAEWGEARCEHGDFAVGLDEAVMGTTAQQALDVAAGASSLTIAWDDGTETAATVSFTPDADGACVLLDDMFYGQVAWNVAGELAITSEDGRLDATWPGLLFAAAAEGGGFSQVQFELDTTGALPPVTAENLVTVYGVNGVENLADYDALSLSIQLVLADMAGGVMGELRLVGLQFAPCAQEPSDSTDPMMGSSGGGTAGSSGGGTAGSSGGGTAGSSGGGTAGCQGADTFELLVGTITGG